MAAPIRLAILTVSDRSYNNQRPDRSGPSIERKALELGWQVVETALLPDEQDGLETYFRKTALSGKADVLLTTGGTGFAPRDITPEATRAVVERRAPGLSEIIRSESTRITPHGMLSRGAAGILKDMLIVNLSGSPKAALEQLAVIAPALPHAVQLLRDDPSSESGHDNPLNGGCSDT